MEYPYQRVSALPPAAEDQGHYQQAYRSDQTKRRDQHRNDQCSADSNGEQFFLLWLFRFRLWFQMRFFKQAHAVSPFCRWIFCCADNLEYWQRLDSIVNYYYTYSNNKINIGAAVYEDYQRVSHGIKNFFKSCLVKWLLSEEEGRETETLFLLSVYTASWSSVP